MKRRSFFWRLYLPYLAIAIVSMVLIFVGFSQFVENFYLEDVKQDIHIVASILSKRLEENFELTMAETDKLQNLVNEISKVSNLRLTLIRMDGTVYADTSKAPEQMNNHSDRPEIREAYTGKTSASTRRSPTLGVMMMYVAIPLYKNGKVVSVLRVSESLQAIYNSFNAIFTGQILVFLIITVFITIKSYLIVRQVIHPLEEIRTCAESYAQNDFTPRLPEYKLEEVNKLGGAINNMAEQLNHRIQEIKRQRNELETVLAGMSEGLMAVDTKKRLVTINRTASELFKIVADTTKGEEIEELVDNEQVLKFINRLLNEKNSIHEDITLNGKIIKHLHLHGSIMKSPDDEITGALIVIKDVSRIRKLEQVRQDFVANVSHELKTPITSIKGFVETLIEGAMYDSDNSIKFLSVINKQSDRMNAIINDLLTLSRLEQEDKRKEIVRENALILPIVQTAIDTCKLKAKEKNIDIVCDCETSITAIINGQLLELAITNLLDNAVKFSPSDSKVNISCRMQNSEVRLQIEDHGCGIPEEHMPRLFERFYRVDKSRSRNQGGTGLGLAIVKHIMRLHEGRVEVESNMDYGSKFTLILPVTLRDIV